MIRIIRISNVQYATILQYPEIVIEAATTYLADILDVKDMKDCIMAAITGNDIISFIANGAKLKTRSKVDNAITLPFQLSASERKTEAISIQKLKLIASYADHADGVAFSKALRSEFFKILLLPSGEYEPVVTALTCDDEGIVYHVHPKNQLNNMQVVEIGGDLTQQELLYSLLVQHIKRSNAIYAKEALKELQDCWEQVRISLVNGEYAILESAIKKGSFDSQSSQYMSNKDMIGHDICESELLEDEPLYLDHHEIRRALSEPDMRAASMENHSDHKVLDSEYNFPENINWLLDPRSLNRNLYLCYNPSEERGEDEVAADQSEKESTIIQLTHMEGSFDSQSSQYMSNKDMIGHDICESELLEDEPLYLDHHEIRRALSEPDMRAASMENHSDHKVLDSEYNFPENINWLLDPRSLNRNLYLCSNPSEERGEDEAAADQSKKESTIIQLTHIPADGTIDDLSCHDSADKPEISPMHHDSMIDVDYYHDFVSDSGLGDSVLSDFADIISLTSDESNSRSVTPTLISEPKIEVVLDFATVATQHSLPHITINEYDNRLLRQGYKYVACSAGSLALGTGAVFLLEYGITLRGEFAGNAQIGYYAFMATTAVAIVASFAASVVCAVYAGPKFYEHSQAGRNTSDSEPGTDLLCSSANNQTEETLLMGRA